MEILIKLNNSANFVSEEKGSWPIKMRDRDDWAIEMWRIKFRDLIFVGTYRLTRFFEMLRKTNFTSRNFCLFRHFVKIQVDFTFWLRSGEIWQSVNILNESFLNNNLLKLPPHLYSSRSSQLLCREQKGEAWLIFFKIYAPSHYWENRFGKYDKVTMSDYKTDKLSTFSPL